MKGGFVFHEKVPGKGYFSLFPKTLNPKRLSRNTLLFLPWVRDTPQTEASDVSYFHIEEFEIVLVTIRVICFVEKLLEVEIKNAHQKLFNYAR